VVIYSQLLTLSPAQWQSLRRRVQRILPLPQSRRHQALALGILLAASTYTVTGAESLPLAVGEIALTLLVIGLLLRSTAPAKTENQISPMAAPALGATEAAALGGLEQYLNQLSHSEPLQRLVAVRQLVRLIDQGWGDQPYVTAVSVRSHLLDCFHILLAHEPEPIVRTAIREGLTLLRQSDLLQQPEALPQGPPSLSRVDPPADSRQGHRIAVE
ncbi:MAG: hypothetical protein HC922_02620, partial [Leptolyngbyaceae cyanobacterium SM2_3_12]|nr:hypothetical protein [Leptolyngbyaceae cyanobacterium SM2_3_12]